MQQETQKIKNLKPVNSSKSVTVDSYNGMKNDAVIAILIDKDGKQTKITL
jgi:hypothetical protein